MTYAECLQYLIRLGHELGAVKFDLRAIRALLDSLGNPHQRYPTAIVAGTNGKGSTSSILANILRSAGYRTGLYTSPHLLRVNERIRVDGDEISDQDFAGTASRVREVAERLVANGTLAHLPSFFEILTAVAFTHFESVRVEFAVLEVGMGGRLDATNVTEPRIAIITNVSFDHEEFLGSTLAAIATEKAGVIKEGRPVITTCDRQQALEVIRRRSREQNANLYEITRLAKVSNLQSADGRSGFDLTLNGDYFANLALPLAGRFQIENTLAAVGAAWRLREDGFAISAEAIRNGVETVTWPGRLEVVGHRPTVALDGAHNPAAVSEVARYVRENWAGRRRRLVYASMRDKAIREISGVLFPLFDQIYLTQPPDHPRAASPQEIMAAAGLTIGAVIPEPTPELALERAVHASAPEDAVLVCGSLFLVAAIKEAIAAGRLERLKG